MKRGDFKLNVLQILVICMIIVLSLLLYAWTGNLVWLLLTPLSLMVSYVGYLK